MIITLGKMFPLHRTQVFFLTTLPKTNTEIQITNFTPTEENIEDYKKAFIKEYIKARNEIIPNASVMQRKWSNAKDGIVNSWSTPEVYAQMQKTSMWISYMTEPPDFEFTCPVEFTGVVPRTDDTYAVSFRYFCTNNANTGGQAPEKNSTIVLRKDYTITVKVDLENKTMQWADRLNNPLGIRISEYKIESENGDPLDFK